MKALFLMAAIPLVGCATTADMRWENWKRIYPDQSAREAIEIMGEPHEFTKDGGRDIFVWHMDRFEKCAILLTESGRVEGKTCKDNPEARAQFDAARMQMIQNMRQAPVQNTPMRNPVSVPQRTNCQTRWSGGTAYTDCSSQPTGIDPGIFR